MANLLDWIKTYSDGEEVEAIVIGEMGWGNYNSKNNPHYSEIPIGKVLSFKEAKKYLDYEFDCGYGAPNCNAIYAYTKTWVMAISQYDGATGMFRIPRNPQEIVPEMPGG